MATTSTSANPYTNGRLVVDEDMAFDILDMIENWRVMTLIMRASLIDLDHKEAATDLTTRLNRLRFLRKRIEKLCAEKGWGEALDRSSITE